MFSDICVAREMSSASHVQQGISRGIDHWPYTLNHIGEYRYTVYLHSFWSFPLLYVASGVRNKSVGLC